MPRVTHSSQKEIIDEIVLPSKRFLASHFPRGPCPGPSISPVVVRQLQKVLDGANEKLDRMYSQLASAVEKKRREIAERLRGPYHDFNLSIRVESNRLKSASSEKIIPAKAKFTIPFHGPQVVDCSVSCGHWERIGELKERTINILDHLDKLLPVSSEKRENKGPIGLVTFQNGIMNSYEGEFSKNFELVVDKFPEGTLCIGLYNRTTKLVPKDMFRFTDEFGFNMESAYSLFLILLTLSERLPKINPNLVWAHFAHSEAGLIAHAVFDHCERHGCYHPEVLEKARKFSKGNLVTATYGAVKPIPNDPVLYAINTYTNRDIALTLGKKYLDRDLSRTHEGSFISEKRYEGKTYTIRVVETMLKEEPFIGLKFEFPHESLTLQQRVDMTFMEWLGRVGELEETQRAPLQFMNLAIDELNAKAFAIQDHSFSEATYREVLADDVDELIDRYKKQ